MIRASSKVKRSTKLAFISVALARSTWLAVMIVAALYCHVYVDSQADLAMAEKIVVNAKCQRPSVCNAAETLVVHAERVEALM